MSDHLTWNEAEFAAIKRQDYIRRALTGYAGQVAAAARATAPRSAKHRSPPAGHGADTIHGETVLEDGAWTGRASWDAEHAYMRFTDLGTRHIPAQHFLEHALDRYAH